MRCHICNAVLSNVSFNTDHGDIDPCHVCQEVIDGVFPDPVPEEDLRDVDPTPYELLENVEEEYYRCRE